MRRKKILIHLVLLHIRITHVSWSWLRHQLNSRLALRLQWWWAGSQTSPTGVNKLSKSYLLPGPPPKYSRIMSRRIRATLIPYKNGNFIYCGRLTIWGSRDKVWRCWAYRPACCSSDFWTRNRRVLPTTQREKQKLIPTQFQLGQVTWSLRRPLFST